MSKIPKNTGFKTPPGYFESLATKLSENNAPGESFESNTKLKENAFQVPKGYFENLTTNVLLKVDSKETKVVTLTKRYYYIAASVVALFAIALVYNMNLKQNPSFDNLAGNAIEEYFDNYELDFNENELAELLPIQEVGINDILNSEINQEQIIDYLNDKIEDLHELNDIYNEE